MFLSGKVKSSKVTCVFDPKVKIKSKFFNFQSHLLIHYCMVQ